MMNETMANRIIDEAHYFIENKSTVRKTAEHFGNSKSTVHKDLVERLKYFRPILARKVRNIIDLNTVERHIRGGEATRKKYLSVK